MRRGGMLTDEGGVWEPRMPSYTVHKDIRNRWLIRVTWRWKLAGGI